MTAFTSYAQNFEDVILWRALKHINNGFYIDVGAQDPVVDSVSCAFYQNGWRGVHAEATSYYARKIRSARPDELVVQSAIGNGEGTITFFEIPETGLSTSDRESAVRYLSNGHDVRETTVPLTPLSQLLDDARQENIHWLKIDVEGMETSVIESWSPSVVRPWIVVVESTRPGSQEPSFADWEPTLLQKGYKFAYFDGVSRYYVSNNHQELFSFFGPGPNVFDGFQLSDTTEYVKGLNAQINQLEDRIVELGGQIVQLRGQIANTGREKRGLEVQISEQRQHAAQLEETLNLVYESLSWKLTRPLRQANAGVAWLKVGISSWIRFKPGTRPRRVAAKIIGKSLRWIIRQPRLFRLAKRLLRYSPGMELRLRRVASGDYAATRNAYVLNPDEAAVMAEPTSLVLDRLERAYYRNKAVQES